MRAPVRRVVVRDSAPRLAALELGDGDLRQAGSIETVETVVADEFAVEVELGAAGRASSPSFTGPSVTALANGMIG